MHFGIRRNMVWLHVEQHPACNGINAKACRRQPVCDR